jgi:hypothetical protein
MENVINFFLNGRSASFKTDNVKGKSYMKTFESLYKAILSKKYGELSSFSTFNESIIYLILEEMGVIENNVLIDKTITETVKKLIDPINSRMEIINDEFKNYKLCLKQIDNEKGFEKSMTTFDTRLELNKNLHEKKITNLSVIKKKEGLSEAADSEDLLFVSPGKARTMFTKEAGAPRGSWEIPDRLKQTYEASTSAALEDAIVD